ncbi:MAG: right-handed parallel beta-helix repeat-containing protein [Paraglaciecola sp.]|uniref:right-handed parallel beta-helix repeat-containing protein n=1 Tax=Paraglaciecola sp. TaxID=1920173 RepID=UPI003297B9E7
MFLNALVLPCIAVAKLMTLVSIVIISLFSINAIAADKVIQVQNVEQLFSALRHGNKYGNTHIKLQDGTYIIDQSLIILGNGITLSSGSGNRRKVIISGLGMKKTKQVNNLIRVSGKHFTLDGITLQFAGNHLIQIAGEQDADFPTLRNCVLKDSYEQLFKVSYNRKTKVASDNGLIENCEFSYTAGIGPQYYIGGIDVHGGHNWIVRKNQFKGIASPGSKVAEHAIHFWNNTKNTLIEDNVIINCDRGIGFGMENRPTMGGIIRNNTIYHNAPHHPNADVGIVLEESPNTQVLNNKIYLGHSYPNSIEYRFSSTINVLIQGNLTNRPIRKRDGAHAKLIGNQRSRNLKDFLSPQLQAEFSSHQN